MKKHFQYAFTLLITFAVFGCTDLEEDLKGEITEDFSYIVDGNSTGPASTLGTAYTILLQTGTANHSGYFTLQEVTSDEMVICVKGADWNFSPGLVDLHQHNYTPDNEFLQFTWSNMYSAIGHINMLMSFYANSSSTYKIEAFAELKASRAYLYWRLMDLFGSVKIITETDENPPQSTRQEVFDFIEQELLDVLSIPAVKASMDWSNTNLPAAITPYRMSPYAVLGLLAKLYLNAEIYTGIPMYNQAELAASAIIDSGQYQLCGDGCSVNNLGQRAGVSDDPQRLEGYAAVFAPNNDDNPEHIFSLNYDQIRGTGMNFSQMNLHPSSQISWHLNQQPWNGYATLEEFYNTYEENDERRKASFLEGPQLDFGGSAILDYDFDDESIQLNYTPKINELMPNSLREAGVRAKKFSYQLFGRADMNNDFPILRLGEIYLIRAEAKARQSGNWADAEIDVNILRARAGVAAYKGTLTADEFLAERGREMFHETARRTDLIRFGKYNAPWWEKPASEAFKNIFPIPRDQILADPELTQNPGY